MGEDYGDKDLRIQMELAWEWAVSAANKTSIGTERLPRLCFNSCHKKLVELTSENHNPVI